MTIQKFWVQLEVAEGRPWVSPSEISKVLEDSFGDRLKEARVRGLESFIYEMPIEVETVDHEHDWTPWMRDVAGVVRICKSCDHVEERPEG